MIKETLHRKIKLKNIKQKQPDALLARPAEGGPVRRPLSDLTIFIFPSRNEMWALIWYRVSHGEYSMSISFQRTEWERKRISSTHVDFACSFCHELVPMNDVFLLRGCCQSLELDILLVVSAMNWIEPIHDFACTTCCVVADSVLGDAQSTKNKSLGLASSSRGMGMLYRSRRSQATDHPGTKNRSVTLAKKRWSDEYSKEIKRVRWRVMTWWWWVAPVHGDGSGPDLETQ